MTGEIVIKRKKFRARGGWLSRMISFNSVTGPYTFDGVCGVKNELAQLERNLNIKAEYK